MHKVLLLPGDGQGPEAVETAGRILSNATDQVDVVTGSIGASAYEKCGEFLPLDTIDQVSRAPVVIAGPTEVTAEGDNARNPLLTLLAQLDLYARSRTFRTLADGLGIPGVDLTIWGSIMNPQVDITETPDVDGITLSKYIHSDCYVRMLNAALSDMEADHIGSTVCIARDDLFPKSSRAFYEMFDALFQNGRHENIRNWATRTIMDPTRDRFAVVADLYVAVAESIAAGVTGGNRLTPTKLVGDGRSIIFIGDLDQRDTDTSTVCAVSAAAEALKTLGLTEEHDRVVQALRDTLASGERAADIGGTLSSSEFTDRVVSRL